MRTCPHDCATIRTFRSEDASACLQLYREGLLGGKIADNDTGLDMDDIPAAYLANVLAAAPGFVTSGSSCMCVYPWCPTSSVTCANWSMPV